MKCLIPFCKNYDTKQSDKVRFYRITKERYSVWMSALGMALESNPVYGRKICSEHFSSNCFQEIDNVIKPNAIPTLKLRQSTFNRKSIPISVINKRDALETPAESPEDCENDTLTSYPEIEVPISENITLIIDNDSDNDGSTQTAPETVQPVQALKRNKILENKDRNRKQSNVYLRMKVYHLNDIVKHLRYKGMLSPDACYMLEKSYSCISFAAMKRILCNSRMFKISRKTYDPILRKFAITLQLYSSKVYEYVRRTFNIPFPSQKIIRKWYSNMSCDPGFSQLAFLSIVSKVKENNDRGASTFCHLLLDETSIKTGVDCFNGKLWGYVDLGSHLDDDSIEIATQVLVLMVVSLNGEWKLPIGYFFVRSLTVGEKANLVREALILLHDCGVVVTSLTCDGPAINFGLLTELGAQFNDITTTIKKANIVPFFHHPSDNSSIFVIFDSCHLVNILRINWACLRKFLDPDGNEVDFKYISTLQNIQAKDGLLNWQKHKLKKSNITIQELSQNVTSTIEFLKDKVKDVRFKEASATIKFIHVLDKVYDVLNSTNPFTCDKWMPIKTENEDYWLPILQGAVNYFANCHTSENVSLISTKHKAPFKGFILTFLSIMGIYQTYIKPDDAKLEYLLTYKLSQDHLEEFFTNMRSSKNWDGDPTAWQFRNAYQDLVLHHYIKYVSGNSVKMLLNAHDEVISVTSS